MLNITKNGEVVLQVNEGGAVNLDGFHASPVKAGWEFELDGNIYTAVEAPPPPEPEPPTPEQIKASLADHAAQKRYEKEVGGTIWNGWPVHTDRESQSKIIAEGLAIEAGERTDPDAWKFADGVFRMVSNEDFTSLASAVRQHVRDCFALEGQVLALITTGVITTTEQIDLVFEHGIEALYGENEQSEDK